MRIAIFSDNFYPELSGIADSIVVLGKELAHQNHEVRFYAPYYTPKNFQRVGLEAKELDLGPRVSVHRFFATPIPSPTQQSRMVIPTFSISDVKQFKPDVIHTQSFFGAGLNGLIASKRLRVPLVGTNHTAIGEFFRANTVLKTKQSSGWVVKFAVWYYNQCRFVSGPSESVFTELVACGFKQPHGVISNPVDTETFSPAVPVQRADLKRRLGFSDRTILYAGRLGLDKSVEVIVRALPEIRKKVPETMLAIAGHGETEAALRALARELNVTEAVKFLGTLDKTALAEVYRASDVFAIMSISETQSLTLMQAMASGIPVIGARARALPEYISAETGFLVEPGDYRDLAEKAVNLLTDGALRARLGAGGRASTEKFSPHHIAERWLEVYQQAVHNRPSLHGRAGQSVV